MNRVGVDRLGKIGADSARVGFLGIGRPHQLAVARDCALTFEDLNDYGARGHELDEVRIEGTLFVLGVETTGKVIRQVQHFGRNNSQARLFKTADNLANHVFPHRIGLDNR